MNDDDRCTVCGDTDQCGCCEDCQVHERSPGGCDCGKAHDSAPSFTVWTGASDVA